MQTFDVRQPQALYAAWDVLRSSKPACLLHTPLIAPLVSKWTSEYLASPLPATALHLPCCDTIPVCIEHASAWIVTVLQSLLVRDMIGSSFLHALRETCGISLVCCIVHSDALGRAM